MKKSILFFILGFSFTTASSQFQLGIESGLVFEGYNDIRIPNTPSATEFSFTEDFELQGLVIPIRLTLAYTFAEKNHIFLLYAPLDANYEGSGHFNISFQDVLFPQGQINGYYKFNSYRLTYARDIVKSPQWTFRLGFTAKIRDARVQLSTDDRNAKKDDVGFVPLLHLYGSYKMDKWEMLLEGDGLAGGPGRAFDFFLGSRYYLTENFSLKAGYRFLEGGADVNEVYNFALFHFGSVGLGYEF